MAEPLIQQFFAKAEESLLTEWVLSGRDAKEYREKLYYFVQLTHDYRKFFEDFLANEAYAIQQLREMDEQS